MSDVVQVSFHRDRWRRDPEALLAAWAPLRDLAAAAAAAGVDVAVVQPSHADAVLHQGGVAFHFVRESLGLRRGTKATRPVGAAANRLAARVRELRPSLLHVHGLSLPDHARRLKERLPGARLLAQDHADGLPRPWRRRSARRGIRSFDAVAFTSVEQAEPFRRAGLLPDATPVHELLEASTGFTPADPAAAREAAGIHGDPCFVWVGRLDANKDPLTVLDGFAAAAPAFPDPRLWMAFGDAPLLARVQRRVLDDPRLRDRVHLLGRLRHAEVEPVLRGADYLLLGSHREGSGFAVLEALACGVTPVVTDIPALRAIVGQSGRLWAPGDAAALERTLRSLVGADRARLRDIAIDRFRRELSWDAIGRRLARIYEAVLSGSGPASPASAGTASVPASTR